MNYIYATRDHFDKIDALWKKDRSKLGMYPAGAFLKDIDERKLLIALDQNESIKGYLLFRIIKSKQSIGIVHLCVDSNFRGAGISLALLDKLKVDVKGKFKNIRLNCRSDYLDANKFWEKNGFRPKNVKNSRGKDQSIFLRTWVLQLEYEDLFTSFGDQDKIRAMVDYNTILELKNDFDHLLNGSWMHDDVLFYYSDTIFNKLSIINSEKIDFSLLKENVRGFLEISSSHEIIHNISKCFHEKDENVVNLTDFELNQLSTACASHLKYFITDNQNFNRIKPIVSDLYDVKILNTEEFVLNIDQLVFTDQYFPEKLLIEGISMIDFCSNDIENLVIDYKLHDQEANLFKTSLVKTIGSNKSYAKIIKIKEESQALFIYEVEDKKINIRNIKLKSSMMKNTLFSFILKYIIDECLANSFELICVDEFSLTDDELGILDSFGFYRSYDNTYFKIIIRKIFERDNFIDTVSKIVNTDIEVIFDCDTFILEKRLWPSKFIESNIPCYIIPIKSYYAKALFDKIAVSQDIFSSENPVIWNNTGIYYRAVNPNVEKFPARILWYVSEEKNFGRTKGIVACSLLEKVEIGPAIDLYTKYKNYGIYNWDDHILKLAKGKKRKNIKVLKFSSTEVFPNVISYNRLETLIRDRKESFNNLQSPLKVHEAVFFSIYHLAGLKFTL